MVEMEVMMVLLMFAVFLSLVVNLRSSRELCSAAILARTSCSNRVEHTTQSSRQTETGQRTAKQQSASQSQSRRRGQRQRWCAPAGTCRYFSAHCVSQSAPHCAQSCRARWWPPALSGRPQEPSQVARRASLPSRPFPSAPLQAAQNRGPSPNACAPCHLRDTCSLRP